MPVFPRQLTRRITLPWTTSYDLAPYPGQDMLMDICLDSLGSLGLVLPGHRASLGLNGESTPLPQGIGIVT